MLKILHDSHNLFFRAPFGALSCEDSLVLRLLVHAKSEAWDKESTGAVGADGAPEWPRAWLRLSQNNNADNSVELLPMSYVAQHSDGDKLCFQTTIKMPSKPSLLWYSFIVEDKHETFFYGNNEQRAGGRGEQGGSIQRTAGSFDAAEWEWATSAVKPPAYQVTVAARDSKVPTWYTRGLMYQVFVERFHPGSGPRWQDAPANTGALFHASWQDKPFYIKDALGRIERWTFFGGNLEGVRFKLPYLRSLGVSVLYLNPIFEASSSHKYDTADYHAIDPMFGGQEAFDDLVRAAAELGIAIVLDGVFSHTGSDSRYFNRYGRYPELGAYQSPNSPYASWYRFKKFPHKYECWWGVDALPNVEELDSSYLKFICDGKDSVIRTWLRQGAKGWRLDVADELPDEFIRSVRAAMNEETPEAVLIGEVWEDASCKVSYGELRPYFAGDELHATMNYPFRKLLVGFLLDKISAERLASGLMSLRENYPYPNFMAAMNLIGSHDQMRILTVLGGAPPQEALTDEERRGFCLSEHARDLAKRRLNLLVLWQMTYPGVPCIYYGDEAGLEGYSDPYNRAPFPWGNEDGTIMGLYQRWTRLRNEHEVFISGDVVPFSCGNDVGGFWRIAKTDDDKVADDAAGAATAEGATADPSPAKERALVVINRSEQNQDVAFAGPVSHPPEERRPHELTWPKAQQWDIFDLASGKVDRAVSLDLHPYHLHLEPYGARVLLLRPTQKPRPLFDGGKFDSNSNSSNRNGSNSSNSGSGGTNKANSSKPTAQPARRAGVLLPLSALPGSWGIGDWGATAYAFVDQLAAAGQSLWQLLPLNPLGEGNSPYLSDSAFALNPLLINPEQLWDFLEEHVGTNAANKLRSAANRLKRDSLLKAATVSGRIDYPLVSAKKELLLRTAFACWDEHGLSRKPPRDFKSFCESNADWLKEYALFKALRNEHGGQPWTEWPAEYRTRDQKALQLARKRLRSEMDYQIFVQYLAHHQQGELRAYAQSKNCLLMGDIPMFVAGDSVDCWAHQELFWLNANGVPSVVAGVPPDYFSANGQRWGNPLYRWEKMESNDYAWWRRRFERLLQHFDLVRLDHFRGFEAYWQIDAAEPTAVNGLWMKGPGRRFFASLTQALGPLPLVAEDLGYITAEVELLKQWFGYPGMKVLQFAYPDLSGDADTVYYTGTHDNDTLVGWLVNEKPELADDARGTRSTGRASATHAAARSFIESVFKSDAGLVIVPVQDILGLSSEARVNVPGTKRGNWEWQMREPDADAHKKWNWLQKLTSATGRSNKN